MVGRRGGDTYPKTKSKQSKSGGVGGSGSASNDPCAIHKSIPLQAVELDHLKGLRPGRKLVIERRTVKGARSVVCVRGDTNKIIGSIAFTGTAKLLKCMDEGHRYEGTLESIDGASVVVLVENI
jgi:hypothetical protein